VRIMRVSGRTFGDLEDNDRNTDEAICPSRERFCWLVVQTTVPVALCWIRRLDGGVGPCPPPVLPWQAEFIWQLEHRNHRRWPLCDGLAQRGDPSSRRERDALTRQILRATVALLLSGNMACGDIPKLQRSPYRANETIRRLHQDYSRAWKCVLSLSRGHFGAVDRCK